MFTDSHCHIYSIYYENIESIIKESEEYQTYRFINNGCNTKTNKEVINLISKFKNMYGAIGIHPEDVEEYTKDDIDYIKNNLNNTKIVAIGEIGLDYHYTKDNKEKQIKLFEQMLKIAEDNNLPVIVHSREATKDTIDILKKYKVKGVIHSFSGSLETAKEYIKMGFYLGVNGVITFKNSNIKDIYKEIPINKIILETDSPYLTPEPYRGTKNSPRHIIDIADYISKIKNIDLKELSNITENNINELYNINVENK